METSEMLAYLRENLGEEVTHMLGGGQPGERLEDVLAWRWGSRSRKVEARIREAYRAVSMIADEAGPDTAKAWLYGSSPFLGEESAALVLSQYRFKQGDIVTAARSFLDGAY